MPGNVGMTERSMIHGEQTSAIRAISISIPHPPLTAILVSPIPNALMLAVPSSGSGNQSCPLQGAHTRRRKVQGG